MPNLTRIYTVPPKFRWRPKGISSFTNTDVELECDIYGNPKPTIEWLKNGEVVVSSHYFQIINGRNLRILGLMKTDEGMYQCTASNAVGMIQSSAWLKVIQKGFYGFHSYSILFKNSGGC